MYNKCSCSSWLFDNHSVSSGPFLCIWKNQIWDTRWDLQPSGCKVFSPPLVEWTIHKLIFWTNKSILNSFNTPPETHSPFRAPGPPLWEVLLQTDGCKVPWSSLELFPPNVFFFFFFYAVRTLRTKLTLLFSLVSPFIYKTFILHIYI